MRDLIAKLESLKDSKEWGKIVSELRDTVKEQNALLLEWTVDSDEEFTEWHFIRHQIEYINELKEYADKVKDKECREAIKEDLDKSLKWREDRILGKTNEYKLDSIDYSEASYTVEDLYRVENWWIECFNNLPSKILEALKVKEVKVEEMADAEVQEQIDALASLEAGGL